MQTAAQDLCCSRLSILWESNLNALKSKRRNRKKKFKDFLKKSRAKCIDPDEAAYQISGFIHKKDCFIPLIACKSHENLVTHTIRVLHVLFCRLFRFLGFFSVFIKQNLRITKIAQKQSFLKQIIYTLIQSLDCVLRFQRKLRYSRYII